MKLIIAEKNSVGQAIAAVLGAKERNSGYLEGGGYLVSWCVGHLAGLARPEAYDTSYDKWRYGDLPILPKQWQFAVGKDKRKQFDVLRGLMRREDVTEVVNACDAGREGELIFRTVYHLAGCAKPMKRLWISSMEDTAIRRGFDGLKPGGEYDGLHQAALCRSQADWLVGINATRLFSVLYRQTLNIGRVMTPTLALLVQREEEIAAFVKTPFYIPELDCGGFTVSGQRQQNRSEAETIRAACDGRPAVVTSVQRQEKETTPPRLYDLTTLQREANRLFGFTAQQTLDYLQSLYEKKLATYPRTDSRFLTEDMAAGLPVLVNQAALVVPGIRGKAAVTCDAGLVTDNSRVSDHHAILPTMEIRNADLAALPSGERDILFLVSGRLLCAVAERHRYAETVVTVGCEGNSFEAKGKTVLHGGWKTIDAAYRTALKSKPEENGEPASLPELTEGQRFVAVRAAVKEGFTTPPKHYTEDTLLKAMETAGSEETPEDAERKGLGTPATRAGILEKLVKTGLVERKNKQLLPAKKGINLIAVLPEVLKSPMLTAEWEHRLKLVERGGLSDTEFIGEITALTAGLVKDNSAPNLDFMRLFPAPVGSHGEPVGVCPRCGAAVREGKKSFYCENRDCGFALWRYSRFFVSAKKELTKEIAAELLEKGRVSMSGLYSPKTGKTYRAVVVLEDTGKYVNYKLEFEKGGRK
ncbi:DNA topoisomerase 3 [Oxobacter pfennigii]|uniref:DNA topoisomerase n=1 Tax=Oxobacter pfennigii TaxID=36849 RepID=A0A0P9AHZ9_9CLOT|nr:type IA DNA topoisomerase [Oxobacter pfennigii]KPU45079.1 DNA topoisomerase 3 [Oxobacter pfennigii]